MTKLITLLLFSIPINLLAQRELQFVEERIDFTIDKKFFSVNGIYYFLNNSDKELRQTLLFPFSINTDSLFVKRVYNLTYPENLNIQKLDNAITFKLHVLPRDTVKVNIAYSQKTLKENIYILESTQHWGQALERAYYSLTFDTSVRIDSLSIKPDFLDNNVYYWKKKDFYPNEDFKVWIK